MLLSFFAVATQFYSLSNKYDGIYFVAVKENYIYGKVWKKGPG